MNIIQYSVVAVANIVDRMFVSSISSVRIGSKRDTAEVVTPAGPSRPPDSLTHSTHFEYNALLCAHCVGAVPLDKTWSISFCPLHPVAKCLLSGDKKDITPCKSNKGQIWTTTHLHRVVLLIWKSSFVLIFCHRMLSLRIGLFSRFK